MTFSPPAAGRGRFRSAAISESVVGMEGRIIGKITAQTNNAPMTERGTFPFRSLARVRVLRGVRGRSASYLPAGAGVGAGAAPPGAGAADAAPPPDLYFASRFATTSS